MCDECLQNPHHPRCPNASNKVIGECANCGEELTELYERFKDNEGNLFCNKECACIYHGITEDYDD